MNRKRPKSPDSNKPSGQKEILELQRLECSLKKIENELKWSSGWRRFADRFISPILLGVFGVLITAIITLQSWNTKQEQDTLAELQKNLIVPAFTVSSTEALIEAGDKGYRIILIFLSNVDSSHNGASKRIFDALLELAKSNESRNKDKTRKIFSYLLLPLLTSKDDGVVNKQTLEFINYVYTKLHEMQNVIADSHIRDNLAEAFNRFRDWEIRWHEQQRNEFYAGNTKWIRIPPGAFLVYNNYLYMAELDEFIVRGKIIPLDSAKLHNLCDSLDLKKDDLNIPISKIIKELKIERYIRSYTSRPSIYIQKDTTVATGIELEVDPDLEFRLSSFKFSNNEKQIDLMKYKFTNGILGTKTNIYPYASKEIYRTRVRYLRYKNNALTKLQILRLNGDVDF